MFPRKDRVPSHLWRFEYWTCSCFLLQEDWDCSLLRCLPWAVGVNVNSSPYKDLSDKYSAVWVELLTHFPQDFHLSSWTMQPWLLFHNRLWIRDNLNFSFLLYLFYYYCCYYYYLPHGTLCIPQGQKFVHSSSFSRFGLLQPTHLSSVILHFPSEVNSVEIGIMRLCVAWLDFISSLLHCPVSVPKEHEEVVV